MSPWYNCLLLQNRTLNAHEIEYLKRANVLSVRSGESDFVIGPEGSPLNRPMYVQLTHHHHVDALLAMIGCYVDPKVTGSQEYPLRSVHLTEPQRP
ncbi:hypothetical protein KUCAC02_033086 [Chaenocephalus aceratus]|nr:hypothetical protein KUCAC02_033086 [Chaenocephalus aceratus]